MILQLTLSCRVPSDQYLELNKTEHFSKILHSIMLHNVYQFFIEAVIHGCNIYYFCMAMGKFNQRAVMKANFQISAISKNQFLR